MPIRTSPAELKSRLRDGLLSFPLTDFDDADQFDAASFRARLDWLSSFPSAGQFIAGGAGEFFSLTEAEFAAAIRIAVDARPSHQLVIGAAGYGTRMAIAYAQETERAGADGILLLPPYLTETSQQGLFAHIGAICAATGLGVIVYNRANCRLTVDTVIRLADAHSNFVAVKDGLGDTEELLRIRAAAGDRLAFINGMPTAEIYAQAYLGMGIPTYSSAIFNFIPDAALAFRDAVMRRDEPRINEFLTRFLLPYSKLRARQPGYAVSIVKAGVRAIGRSAGKVRPPLSDLTPDEYQELTALIARVRN
jgi:5-dehydro-4-deoxyglucarate dehydratase